MLRSLRTLRTSLFPRPLARSLLLLELLLFFQLILRLQLVLILNLLLRFELVAIAICADAIITFPAGNDRATATAMESIF